ncbi:ribose transport system permease protein [Mesorhizobium robiniae]|uniref:Ribose transport system permease protein n=1 Tax=Mesorhizobium robiniae TaxID=559315 RepID=A0ABV2GIP1_9HYPH
MTSRVLAKLNRTSFGVEFLIRLVPTIVVFAGFALYQPVVASPGNLWNIALQTCYLAIFTLGQVIVLITAGLDLSIGLAVSYVSVVAALAMVQVTDNPLLAVCVFMLVGMAVGLLIGAFNGFFVSIVRINPFVVTLATFNILLALSSTVTKGFPVSGFPPQLGDWLVNANVLGVPIPLVMAAVVMAAIGIILSRTVFGRSLYLIGSNPRMAFVAGINVRLHTLGAYMLCSGLAAFGAILLTARAGSGEPNIGGSLALETIAAAVIGGARLRGGEGGVGSALAGALFITVLSNGMNLARIDGYIQQLCIGAIIILSLVFDQLSRGSSRSS